MKTLANVDIKDLLTAIDALYASWFKYGYMSESLRSFLAILVLDDLLAMDWVVPRKRLRVEGTTNTRDALVYDSGCMRIVTFPSQIPPHAKIYAEWEE